MKCWHAGALVVQFAIAAGASATLFPDSLDEGRIAIRVDARQAQLTLDLLSRRAAGRAVAPELWVKVVETEAFRRLMDREQSIDDMLGIDRGYSDSAFVKWAESEAALKGLPGREVTLARWMTIDTREAAQRALGYLPAGTTLMATIYPIVREQANSFVWDLARDPAIFFAVAEDVSADDMMITLAHELHHVGLATGCLRADYSLSDRQRAARGWLSGFGEGIAVLAAAGGPDGPTHAPDDEPGIASWTARLDSLETDLRRVESFLMDVVEGRLEDTEIRRRGMAFVNSDAVPQGPFYSLGWFMASTVERQMGREAVLEAVCDHGRLLTVYQRVATSESADSAEDVLPRWSPEVLKALALEP